MKKMFVGRRDEEINNNEAAIDQPVAGGEVREEGLDGAVEAAAPDAAEPQVLTQQVNDEQDGEAGEEAAIEVEEHEAK